MKVLLCFGTRPEAIKMAPVVRELQKKNLDFKVCVTAQHREMLDQALEFFEITPHYDLDLMKPNQPLNRLSAAILNAVDEVLEQEKPDVVLVQGDTATSSMAALAAFHRKVKVGHVEAGLRTYKKAAPFPEEINRQLTTRLADFHFVPTKKTKCNLIKEQIPEAQIFITGNTVVDALDYGVSKIENLEADQIILNVGHFLLDSQKKLILVTGHRRENFGNGLMTICEALLELSEKENMEIIYPVHLNPKVKRMVHELLSGKDTIHLIPPVSYPIMLWLMRRANLIISDSGGIQEEAPTFKKPVLVTRKVSERMESVELGFSILVGTDKKKIISEALRILDNPPNFSDLENPYGDGKAAGRIVAHLFRCFN